MSKIAEQLEELINQGEALKGRYSDADLTGAQEYLSWVSLCNSTISSIYGRTDQKARVFRSAPRLADKIQIMRTLKSEKEDQEAAVAFTSPQGGQSITVIQNQQQSQVTSITQEFSMRIDLQIDHSPGLTPEQKTELKKLHNELKEEVQKEKTNWEKVTGILKKSFDFGMGLAPDLVRLADAYYRAKGGA